MTELLAFDVGDDIVGIIDLRTDTSDCYPDSRMADGADRILDCDDVVINFNGIRYDMPTFANIAGITDADALPLNARKPATNMDARDDASLRGRA